MKQPPPCGTVLAFDVGLARTGVAVGELTLGVAHPLCVLHAPSTAARLDAIAPLIREWQPVLLVLGLPCHPDGQEHEMTRVAKNFARKLESRTGLPVVLFDERYTSAEADEMLRAQGLDAAGRKTHLDAVAAQCLLQGFFDDRRIA